MLKITLFYGILILIFALKIMKNPQLFLSLKKKLKERAENGSAVYDRKKLLLYIGGGILACLLLFLIIGLIVLYFLMRDLPNIDDPRYLIQAKSTIIYDREGNELYTIHGDENRRIISFEEIPNYTKIATLAIEDDQFYEHIGIDVGAILRAVCHEAIGDVGGLCPRRGGSTITQQLAKNIYLDNSRSYVRKLREMILAMEIEHKYSKDEILHLYLNLIPYGNNAYGVESAANLYFGKPASELSLAESTIIAALPNAPTRYSPYGQNRYSSLLIEPESLELQGRVIRSEEDLSPSEINRGLIGKLQELGPNSSVYIRGRVDLILRRMLDLKLISQEEKDLAWTESQQIEFKRYREPIKHPHFVFFIKEQLEQKYGKEFVEAGGLKVYTSIDPILQESAERHIEEKGERNASVYGSNNIALVAIDPKTGQIKAMVGSRDYFDTENDGNVNVAIQPRLPGSSFKPFAYAAAFLKGYAPATVVYDVETHFGGGYKPKNFAGTFSGPVTMRKALGNSLNIPAVKAGILADIPNVIDLAKKMGIQFFTDESHFGSSLALGAGEVRLLDLVSAYGVFANGGVRKEPVSILKIIDSNNAIIEEWKDFEAEPVIDPQLAFLVTDILSDPNARGAGFNQYLQLPGRKNAAKTGTANKKVKEQTVPSDGWTVGYTPSLVAGVWSGNNDGSQLGLSAAGLLVAAPVWQAFMNDALAGQEAEDFVMPEGIRRISVSSTTGKAVSEFTPADQQRSDIFADFNLPTQKDDSYIEVEIDKVTGLLSSEECPAEAREKKVFFDPHSIRRDEPLWESPVRAWYANQSTFELAPTEQCTMDADSPRLIKPEVIIRSPSQGASISPNGIGVWVDITSPNKIQQVNYYLDDELLDTVTSAPFKGSLTPSVALRLNSSHVIRAEVIDEFLNSSSNSVEVSVEKDSDQPKLSFIFPKDQQQFQPNSVIEIALQASDQNSDISLVDLYFNGTFIARKRDTGSFTFNVTTPDQPGSYQIRASAEDSSGNETEASISIEVNSKAPERILETESETITLPPPPVSNGRIQSTEPQAGAHYLKSSAIPFALNFPDSLTDSLERIDIYAVVDGKTLLIASSSLTPGNSSFAQSLPAILPAGKITIYGKIQLTGQDPKVSDWVDIYIDDI